MAESRPPVKLKRGTLTRVARRFSVSVAHVSLILKGERAGRPNLMAALEREIEKQSQQKANAA